MLIQLAKDRVIRNGISASEEELLRLVAQADRVNSTSLADKMKKTRQYASNLLTRMVKLELIQARSEGRNRYYSPTLDVVIAYGEE